MCNDQPIDKLIHNVQTMDRDGCVQQIRNFKHPKLDFSDEFLASLSLDRLRHVLMAACLQAQHSGRYTQST